MRGGIFHAGQRLVIEAAVSQDGSMPAKVYVESLGEKDRAKLYALFRLLGNTGRITNSEKFKKIEGTQFWEFKSFQIRLPCFFMPGGRVVITHGFRKKKKRIPTGEINRASRIRNEHIEREKGKK